MKIVRSRTCCGLILTLIFSSSTGGAYTTAETNEVVRSMLESVLLSVDDNLDGSDNGEEVEAIVTWPSFLALGESEGWTPPEKKAAFAWYLSMLGTNDCTSLSGTDQVLVRIALSKCEVLNYAEAAPSYKALALNAKGVYRNRAIELAIKYSPVCDSMTAFVETIITNSIGYSFMERGEASDKYAWKLLSFDATNSVQREVRGAGVRMFYRNRSFEAGETPLVDELFVKYIDGYGISSNRFMHAANSFTYPICAEIFGDYFTSVTNQLLSSGQPLPWINVGGGDN